MLHLAICIVALDDNTWCDKKAPIVMSKYDILTSVAEKVQALGNDVKLKILALLIEEGSKSITDISKELNINFSTAHKYLEQLEAAGLVSSKQISENRMKRMFTIRDFDLALSPTGISEMINGKSEKEAKKGLKVLNEKGELVDFDEKIFSQKYLKRGLPRGTIVTALSAVLEHAYNGITLLELRRMFSQELEKKVSSIKSVFSQIEDAEKHKRTYAHLLSIVHPEALDMHANGDIFIKNLREPKLLNFVHDLRGIAVHGTRGKKISNLPEFLLEIRNAIEFVNGFTNVQGLDSFNTHLSPFCKSLARAEIYGKLEKFFNDLPAGTKMFVSIDFGMPRFSNLPVEYIPEGRDTTYVKFADNAQIIAEEVLKFFKANQAKIGFELIIKLWDKMDLSLLKDLENFYVANMKPEWQNLNASYVGPLARFDAEWKSWLGTQRTGEIQSIVINLPRIAQRTADADKFLKELQNTVGLAMEHIYNMGELVIAEFFRKRNTYLPSAKQGRWNYVPVENCVHTIAITGLAEALKILTDSPEHSAKLAEKVLKFCEGTIAKQVSAPLRLALKEDSDTNIARRFYEIDSKLAKLALRDYTVGMGCSDPRLNATACKLQKYLAGGHCLQTTKSKLPELLKGEVGLVFIGK